MVWYLSLSISGHSAPLLGLQAGGEAQLLQAGRFTGKVAKTEPSPFPPWALLEVSWVCQMSSRHKQQTISQYKRLHNSKITHLLKNALNPKASPVMKTAHVHALCAFSWNVGMCVFGEVDCPASWSNRDSCFLWFTLNHTRSFIYVLFYSQSVLFRIFDFWHFVPGCIWLVSRPLRITSSWTYKKHMVENKYRIFVMCILFLFCLFCCLEWM